MNRAKRTVHTGDLFKVCRPVVRTAALARTLAECLYWSQFAKHEKEGCPAIWKTGPHLSSDLGIAARTVNRHLKTLSAAGFWKLRYLPRPNHPSPVSWLLFSPLAHELIARAKEVNDIPTRWHRNGAVEGRSDVPSVGGRSDVRTSQSVPTIENIEPSEQEEEDCFPSGEAGEGTNSAHEEVLQEKLDKAPSYLKVDEESQNFVAGIQGLLRERCLPEWESASKFPWVLGAKLRRSLYAAGLVDQKSQLAFLAEVFDRWSSLRPLMEWRYSGHPSNQDRPSPMALERCWKAFFRVVFAPTPSPSRSGFDHDFS